MVVVCTDLEVGLWLVPISGVRVLENGVAEETGVVGNDVGSEGVCKLRDFFQ